MKKITKIALVGVATITLTACGDDSEDISVSSNNYVASQNTNLSNESSTVQKTEDKENHLKLDPERIGRVPIEDRLIAILYSDVLIVQELPQSKIHTFFTEVQKNKKNSTDPQPFLSMTINLNNGMGITAKDPSSLFYGEINENGEVENIVTDTETNTYIWNERNQRYENSADNRPLEIK